jgi:hypothetical protein
VIFTPSEFRIPSSENSKQLSPSWSLSQQQISETFVAAFVETFVGKWAESDKGGEKNGDKGPQLSGFGTTSSRRRPFLRVFSGNPIPPLAVPEKFRGNVRLV